MGGAFVALADDPSALYWNPSGIAADTTTQVMGMHAFWLEGMSYQFLSATTPRNWGNIGLGLVYSSSGKIPGWTADFQPTDEYGAYDFAGILSYARRMTAALAVGGNVKLIQQSIEEENATGFAVDLGLKYDDLILEGLNAGLSVQNLGPEITFIDEGDPLPLMLRGGLAYKTRSLTFASDLHKPRFNDWRFHIGAEWMLRDILALRTGYETRPELSSAITAGIGVYWRKMIVEYAFVPHEEINTTHYLSITLRV